MKLVPFSQIDEYDTDTWTHEQCEAAGFLHKLDWEGGLAGLLYYSVTEFPEELQEIAYKALEAMDKLNKAVNDWANERGVSY